MILNIQKLTSNLYRTYREVIGNFTYEETIVYPSFLYYNACTQPTIAQLNF